jgi:hypothetical protein
MDGLNLDLVYLNIRTSISTSELIKIVERCKPQTLSLIWWTDEQIEYFDLCEDVEEIKGWSWVTDEQYIKRFENMKKRRTKLVSICKQ